MPWYEVPLKVYVPADGPEEARERVLGALPQVPDDDQRPMASAGQARELGEEELAWWRRLHAVLRQAEKDTAAGHLVSDGRYPGVRFTPRAAAELAALEFERPRYPEI
jgi:hypothetical protein